MEYTIWCDESERKGRYYSNFYGGVLIRSKDLKHVNETLRAVCTYHYLNDEIKWTKVTGAYLEKYKALMDAFFTLVKNDKIKVRIMFSKNAHVPQDLTKEHRDNEYFLLYYQFIKHAFGLEHSNPESRPLYVRVYFDHLPDTLEKRQMFKEYIKGIQSVREFNRFNIRFRKNDITEVDSKHHVALQCLDVVLGSMAFRLNDKHKEKPPGANRRGKKTIAKEKLYRHINGHICSIRPKFNVGISTGHDNDRANRWHHSYRHWLFIPARFKVDANLYK